MNPVLMTTTYYTTENLVEVPETSSHVHHFFPGDAFRFSRRVNPLVVFSPRLFTRFQLLVQTNQDLSEDEVEDDTDGEACQDDTVADSVGFTELLVPYVARWAAEWT